MVQYAKCRKAINRFLKRDRVGEIGHISCIDRRSRTSGLSDNNDLAKDLAAASASRLVDICELLAQKPTSVTARSTHNDRVTCLQAFVKINEQIGIHYFATIDDGPCEHELWIEGSKGSLRTDGAWVWWRKRGWPVFIPTRIGLFGAPSDTYSQLALVDELALAIVRSAGGEGTVSVAGGG